MDTRVVAFLLGGALLVGIAIYVPARILAKYLSRRFRSKSSAGNRITKLGVVVYVPLVLALFAGFAQEHIAPTTWFGQFMSHWVGRFSYAGLLIVIWTCIEYVLSKRGHALWVRISTAQQAAANRREDAAPALFGVEILNDAETPMEFVVDVLQSELSMSYDAAVVAMLHIHNKGSVLLPTGDFAQAERAAKAISARARINGHPLACRAASAQQAV